YRFLTNVIVESYAPGIGVKVIEVVVVLNISARKNIIGVEVAVECQVVKALPFSVVIAKEKIELPVAVVGIKAAVVFGIDSLCVSKVDAAIQPRFGVLLHADVNDTCGASGIVTCRWIGYQFNAFHRVGRHALEHIGQLL